MKLGWFANIGTTDGAENLQDLIKNVATGIIQANLPVDFQLAEVQLDDDDDELNINPPTPCQ